MPEFIKIATVQIKLRKTQFSFTILAIALAIQGCAFKKNHGKDHPQTQSVAIENISLYKDLKTRFMPVQNELGKYIFEIYWSQTHGEILEINHLGKTKKIDTSKELKYSASCQSDDQMDFDITATNGISKKQEFNLKIVEKCPLDKEIQAGQSLNLSASEKFGRIFLRAGSLLGTMQEKISDIEIESLLIPDSAIIQIMNPHQNEYPLNFAPAVSLKIKNVINVSSSDKFNLRFQMIGLRGSDGKNISELKKDDITFLSAENGKQGMPSPSLVLRIQNATNLTVTADAIPGAGGAGGKGDSQSADAKNGDTGLKGKIDFYMGQQGIQK